VELRPGALEDLVSATSDFWRGRRVLVTGHTGFKGSWLSLWLGELGASIHGYALDPPTSPSLFAEAGVARAIATDARADLRDYGALREFVATAQPEVVFHLAAQPLVRESYREPLATVATNVLGTANLLEACRAVESVRALVVVTTDKVYQDRGSPHAYREADALGGHDVYSASKAAAELVTAGYRSSLFGNGSAAAHVATVRAGNVIGGGDWAVDRLVPDCLRAFEQRQAVRLRYPAAVRPWQHVLEPLAGYLMLAQRLYPRDGARFGEAWNFGPSTADFATVGEVAQIAADLWSDGAAIETASAQNEPHETGFLSVDSSKARAQLGWRPRWSVREALERTVAWHRAWRSGADVNAVSREQIREFAKASST
jgi:CDP-glucose 4,6-dehydratase